LKDYDPVAGIVEEKNVEIFFADFGVGKIMHSVPRDFSFHDLFARNNAALGTGVPAVITAKFPASLVLVNDLSAGFEDADAGKTAVE
jgi:hypothetical protein